MDQLIFKKRRKEFIHRIQEAGGGLVIVAAAHETTRNSDVQHAFRQESNFYYLTGLEQPGAIAIFNPQSKKPYTLFVATRDPKQELWVGPSVGPVEAVKQYGADQAFDVQNLESGILNIELGADTLWYHFTEQSKIHGVIQNMIDTLRRNPRAGRRAPHTIRDPFPAIAEMRLIKSKEEIAAIQKAVDVTAHGFRASLAALKPGLKEYQLRATFEHAIRWRGVTRHAYPPIVASGSGTCVLHNPNDRTTIKKDALVLIDAGAEWDYYAADITRTVPASGKFTKEQRTVYTIVLEAQERAIALVKPGATWDQLENVVREFMTKQLIKHKIYSLGRVEGSTNQKNNKLINQSINKEDFSRSVFPHKLGHWLGMDVHDVGLYSDTEERKYQGTKKPNGKYLIPNTIYPILNRQFTPGMVLTIEPGIYLQKSKDIAPEYWGIGIRIEDDILVTRSGYQNLSEKIPKEADDLERLIQKNQ